MSKDKVSAKELELINDKLNSLNDKVDSLNETLYALVSIALAPPPIFTPASTPEASTKEKESEESDAVDVSAVDPGAIRPCKFRSIYIWSENGQGFWAWLTYVGKRSAAGFKWEEGRWIYFGIDLEKIDSFVCY